MAKKAVTLSIVLLSVLAVSHASVRAFSSWNGALRPQDIASIIQAFRGLTNANFGGTGLFWRGRFIWTRITVSAVAPIDVIVRLWIFSAHNNPAWCGYSPDVRAVVNVHDAWQGLHALITTVTPFLEQQNAGFAIAAGMGLYGLDYYVEGLLPDHNPPSTQSFESLDVDQPVCYIHKTGLVSGPKDERTHTDWQVLNQLQELYSPNFIYKLVLWDSCDLVLYKYGRAIWGTMTHGKAKYCQLRLNDDGNLMILDENGKLVWATNAYCQPQPDCKVSANLSLQNDGNLVVYMVESQGGGGYDVKAIWASNTAGS